jgi:hypothetical protein
VEGPHEGTRHEFQQKELTAGNDFSNDLILIHPDVSARHFRVVDETDEIYLEDLTGSNETKLNGIFVSREPLHDGDELQVGPYVFHISLEHGTLPDEAIHELGAQGRGFGKLSLFRRPPALIFLSIGLIIMIYFIFSFFSKEEEDRDLSELGPVPLPVEGIFGYKVGGQNYQDKVEFSFVARGPKYRIQYRPGYINQAGLIRISINENNLSTVPLTIDRWSDELISVDIPQHVLETKETNIVRFDNLRNPPGNVPWGIREISVQEVPIPKCDIEIAKKYIRLANEKYEERQISESNLSDAIRYLKEGQEYLIACEGTEVRDQLFDTLNRCEEELEGRYKEHMFNTKKFLKLKDFYGAKIELEQILLYVPDETDKRHRRARDLLEKINRIVQ